MGICIQSRGKARSNRMLPNTLVAREEGCDGSLWETPVANSVRNVTETVFTRGPTRLLPIGNQGRQRNMSHPPNSRIP